jgi:uncharacterized integral membrane protein
MRLAQWALVVAMGIGAMSFTALNSAERVTLRLGLAELYRVPLPWLVLGAVVLGMLVMFFIGLNHDREMRRLLRSREPREPSRESERERVDEPPAGVAM